MVSDTPRIIMAPPQMTECSRSYHYVERGETTMITKKRKSMKLAKIHIVIANHKRHLNSCRVDKCFAERSKQQY